MAIITVEKLFKTLKEEIEKGHGDYVMFAGDKDEEVLWNATWFTRLSEEELKKEDLAKVTCYGKTTTWQRKKAFNFFAECGLHSEGSESDRYGEIVIQLGNKEKECSDEKVYEEKISEFNELFEQNREVEEL